MEASPTKGKEKARVKARAMVHGQTGLTPNQTLTMIKERVRIKAGKGVKSVSNVESSSQNTSAQQQQSQQSQPEPEITALFALEDMSTPRAGLSKAGKLMAEQAIVESNKVQLMQVSFNARRLSQEASSLIEEEARRVGKVGRKFYREGREDEGCIQGELKSDYYQGTKEKWDKKDIGDQPDEGPKKRDLTVKRHRAGQRESTKKAKKCKQERETKRRLNPS